MLHAPDLILVTKHPVSFVSERSILTYSRGDDFKREFEVVHQSRICLSLPTEMTPETSRCCPCHPAKLPCHSRVPYLSSSLFVSRKIYCKPVSALMNNHLFIYQTLFSYLFSKFFGIIQYMLNLILLGIYQLFSVKGIEKESVCYCCHAQIFQTVRYVSNIVK